MQLGEQFIAAGQKLRPRRQPHRLAGELLAPVVQSVYGYHAIARKDRTQPGEPGPGYFVAGPGRVGFGGATVPWITPAATAP